MGRGKGSLGSLKEGSLIAVAALAGAVSFNSGALAQAPTAPTETAPPTADNAVMLTIFLKHDQSRPLSELNAQLEKQGYYKAFPPASIEVVSWYVMMGIGQVVTLRRPGFARSTAYSRTRPGAAIAPNSIRPTTTRRSAWRRTTRRNSALRV